MIRHLTILSLLLATSVFAADDADNVRPQVALDAQGHTAWVHRVFLDRYGGQLYSASHDKTIRVWDMDTYEPLRVIRPPSGVGLTGEIYAASLSTDETMMAVGGHMAQGVSNDHDVLIISMPGGDKLRRLAGNEGPVRDVAFSPDNKWLATAGDDKIVRVWETTEWTLVKQYAGHTDRIMQIDWSPDSQRLVSASWDRTCRIWDVSNDTSVTLAGHSKFVLRVAWSHDGKTIASGGSDFVIMLWDVATRTPRPLMSLPEDVHTLVFSPDDKLLLYSYGTRRNFTHGAGIVRIADRAVRANFLGHFDTPMTGAFTRDGNRAILGDASGDVCIWSVRDGRLLRRLRGLGGLIHGNGWSPDGRSLAFGYPQSPGLTMQASTPLERSFTVEKLDFGPRPDSSFRRAQRAMGALTIAETSTRVANVYRYGQAIANYQIPFPDERLRSCTLLPGNRAAVGCRYGLLVFNALTGASIYSLPGHTDTVFALSPSPNNKYLLSGGDHTLQVWNMDTYEQLLSLFFAGDEWIAWTPQGYYAASVAGESLMGWHVQRSDDEMAEFYPASRFHAEFYRPDVIRKIIEAGSVHSALHLADVIRGRNNVPTTIKASLPPTVTVTVSGGESSSDGSSTFIATATANSENGEPIRSLRLLIDGRPGEEIRQQETESQNVAKFRITLDSGKHQLAARAETDKSVGISDSIEVVAKGETIKPSRLFVLSLGAAPNVQSDQRGWSNFADADAIANLLGNQKTTDFSEVLVYKLHGPQALRNAMENGFHWLHDNMRPQDVALIYYSGLVTHDDHQNLYLLATDTRITELKTSAISSSFLLQTFQKTAGRILLMIDVEAISSLTNERTEDDSSVTDKHLVHDLLRKMATEDYGVATIGTVRERGNKTNNRSEARFAQAILARLRSSADVDQNGNVDAKELETFVKAKVKEDSNGEQSVVVGHPQFLKTFPIFQP